MHSFILIKNELVPNKGLLIEIDLAIYKLYKISSDEMKRLTSTLSYQKMNSAFIAKKLPTLSGFQRCDLRLIHHSKQGASRYGHGMQQRNWVAKLKRLGSIYAVSLVG